MDQSLKSPTGTHTSRSSFNPFVNRPRLEGLRDRAGAAFRAIMPRRKKDTIEAKRPRTAPYTLRRLRSTSRRDSSVRPTTAVLETTLESPNDAATDVVTPAINSDEGNLPDHDDEMAPIPKALLSKITELARSKQVLTLANQTSQTSIKELELLESRLFTVDSNANEMQAWLADTKDEKAHESEDPEAYIIQVDANIAMYQERIDSMQQHLNGTKMQKRRMIAKIQQLQLEHQRLEDSVLQTIQETWPEPNQGPIEATVTNFAPQMPIGVDTLVQFEQDYEDFSNAIYGEPDPRADYPRRATGDYVQRRQRMRDCREEYRIELSRLEELRNEQDQTEVSGSMDVSTDGALAAQEAVVETKAHILAEAVEECRRAGVHVKDSGSEIVNRPGQPFWDMEVHGKEVIIGFMYENHSIHLFDDGDLDQEPTQEEIDAHIARSQAVAEYWLNGDNAGNDPNEAGPLTPRTPATPGFRRRMMRDIEVGETSIPENEQTQGIEVFNRYREALAAWKATQEEQRAQIVGVMADHETHVDDAATDIWSST